MQTFNVVVHNSVVANNTAPVAGAYFDATPTVGSVRCNQTTIEGNVATLPCADNLDYASWPVVRL